MNAPFRLNPFWNNWASAFILGAALSTLSACNKASYTVNQKSETSNAPGTYSIPPKLDILMVEDDTGSVIQSYSEVTQGATDFLNNLNSLKWDYHFAVMPLTSFREVTQVVGSVYDGNSSPWTAPFPGALQITPDTLSANVFRTVANFSGFLSQGNLSNNLGSFEPGFETIRQVLTTGLGNSHFLRSDAMTVILVVGNGNDTSKVNLCTNGFGYIVPCKQVGGSSCDIANYVSGQAAPKGVVNCDTADSSFQYYQKAFSSVNSNLRFYAAVANETTNSCLFGSSRAGTRYQDMAKALNGVSYDICTNSMSDILSNLQGSLQTQVLNFQEDYIFLSEDANPDSITVTRYIGGNSDNAVTIPQDSKNGWTYEGYDNNVYAVSTVNPSGARVYMNKSSGYAIHLHGSGVVTGGDTVNVSYTPAGAQASTSN